MITEAVQEICEKHGYCGGIEVCIRVPEGAQTAQKTFNPRLGIQGGISILGTSGIVEPMSEKALISSIEVEMKQKASGGKQYLLVAPGNYGLQYLSGHFPFEADEAVKCSNYVGQTIDFAVNMGLKGILFAYRKIYQSSRWHHEHPFQRCRCKDGDSCSKCPAGRSGYPDSEADTGCSYNG